MPLRSWRFVGTLKDCGEDRGRIREKSHGHPLVLQYRSLNLVTHFFSLSPAPTFEVFQYVSRQIFHADITVCTLIV